MKQKTAGATKIPGLPRPTWLFLISIVIAIAGIAVLVLNVRAPELDVFFLLTSLTMTLYAGTALLMGFAFLANRKLFWDLFAVFLVDLILVFGLKTLTNLPRPKTLIVFPEWADAELSSFPSGHASRAFALTAVIEKHFPKIVYAFYALAVLVAVSRVYLGVHHVTDVIAGAFIGLAVSRVVLHYQLGWKIYKWFHPSQ